MPLGNPETVADLFTRLQAERDGRPKIEPNADTVFDALAKKLGIEPTDHKQVAAFPVGARFCDKIRTKEDVHVVVCEYTDEAAAKKGLAFAKNDAVKRRKILRNKATTCAVHQADEKEGAAEAAKIESLFRSL